MSNAEPSHVLAVNAARPRLLRDPFLYGAAAFTVVVCGPISRYLGSLGDEGILLHGATRLLGGEVLYRDFFEVVPPGGFLIVAAWMTIAGGDFGAARALAVGTIALIAALAYAATTLASSHRVLAVLLAAAWAVRAPLENNHHWFTTATSMAAAVCVFLALQESPPRLGCAFVAGVLAGLAVTVTHTRGVLLCAAILAVFVTVPSVRSRLPSIVAGMTVGPGAAIIYLTYTGALGKAADDLIWFASHRYSGVQYLTFASFAKGIDAVTVALFPVAFLLAGVTFALKPHGAIWREPRGRAALALAVVGLLGAFPRPDIAHLSFTVPLACPLLAVGLGHVVGHLRNPARVAVSALAIGLCVVGVTYATKRRLDVMAEPLEVVATPKGVTVRRPGPWTTDYALLIWHLDRLPARDPVFFYPYLPMLPYLTGRRHVAALDAMVPGYTTADQFRGTCARVVRDAWWLIVDRTWSDPRKLRELFPRLADYDPPEKRAFENAMARAFDTVVHRSSTFELRRRGAAVAETMCGGSGPARMTMMFEYRGKVVPS